MDEKGDKKVSVMNTGDSMYISPYVPHSFASRDDKKNFIIALTYLDKVTPQVQDSLSLIGKNNANKILINVDNLSEQKKGLYERYKNNLFLTNKEIKKRTKKSKEYVNRSIRMPSNIWDLVKRISGRNYRSLNSQFIKIVEDWLEDRDYLDANKRTKMDE